MDNAARDLYLRVEKAKQRHPKLKCVLYGGSMGGLIATLMAKAGISVPAETVSGAFPNIRTIRIALMV